MIATAAVTLNVTDVVLTQNAGKHKHEVSHGGGVMASSSMRGSVMVAGLHCAPPRYHVTVSTVL